MILISVLFFVSVGLVIYIMVLKERISSTDGLIEHYRRMGAIDKGRLQEAYDLIEENRLSYRKKFYERDLLLEKKEKEISDLKYHDGVLKLEISNLAREKERLLSQIDDLNEVERLAKELLSKQQ